MHGWIVTQNPSRRPPACRIRCTSSMLLSGRPERVSALFMGRRVQCLIWIRLLGARRTPQIEGASRDSSRAAGWGGERSGRWGGGGQRMIESDNLGWSSLSVATGVGCSVPAWQRVQDRSLWRNQCVLAVRLAVDSACRAVPGRNRLD